MFSLAQDLVAGKRWSQDSDSAGLMPKPYTVLLQSFLPGGPLAQPQVMTAAPKEALHNQRPKRFLRVSGCTTEGLFSSL